MTCSVRNRASYGSWRSVRSVCLVSRWCIGLTCAVSSGYRLACECSASTCDAVHAACAVALLLKVPRGYTVRSLFSVFMARDYAAEQRVQRVH
jgi:hypothetical protein